MSKEIWLEPGSLWEKLKQTTEHALDCGALQPLPSEYEFVEQEGINFIVRILANLDRKDKAGKMQSEKKDSSGREFNPFLPYDKNLFVADISDTHVCLLNKFNVFNYHLLIVTRTFEDQEILLTLEDFTALWACMADFEGLAFYNAGKVAGASQRHKHLQLVPLPLAPQGPEIPIEATLDSVQWQGQIGTTSRLPFLHAIARPDLQRASSRLQAAEAMHQCYQSLLRATGLQGRTLTGKNRQASPYNLLATHQWMLLVPRARECGQSISVNALGFAGALLVRNGHEMQIVKDHGPMNILRGVAFDNESL